MPLVTRNDPHREVVVCGSVVPPGDELGSSPVVRALRFVEAHLDEDLPLARVAAHVDLSQYHFARLFRRETRTSLKRHVIARRIYRARVLLLHSDQSLADIAYQVGFGSQSHMTTLFAKHQGCTPARLRRENRSGGDAASDQASAGTA